MFFVAGADIDAGEGLGAFGGIGLSEMDDVNRGFALGAELLESLGERRFIVGVFQGDGAVLGLDGGGGLVVERGQFLREEAGVARGWRT